MTAKPRDRRPGAFAVLFYGWVLPFPKEEPFNFIHFLQFFISKAFILPMIGVDRIRIGDPKKIIS